MGSMDGIRAACERTASALTARPAIGQKTFVTRVLVHDGLTCDIEEGPWHLTADLPRQLGGQAAGPTPGTFGRAALGSCLAICYVMWAARLGVPLTNVAVEVHADADTRGLLGIEEVLPAILTYGMSCPHESCVHRGHHTCLGYCGSTQSLYGRLQTSARATDRPYRHDRGGDAMNARLQRRIQRYGWNKAVSYYEQSWKQQLASAHTPARDG